jgi:hypothetical protein
MTNYNRFAKSILRIAKAFAIVFACTFMVFTSMAAVDAAPANDTRAKTDLTKGAERLDDVQKKSEEILRNPPMSFDRVQTESSKGLNEVQGDADIQDMSRPSNSRGVTSIQEKAEQVLEKVKGE